MNFIKQNLEWLTFFVGLILMGTMDPFTEGSSFCLFDMIGIPFCPGEGLGHSIAWFFRGEFSQSFQANLFGPIAVIILSSRILLIWKEKYILIKQKEGLKDDTSL